ncbi:MAG: ATP-dependent Clp protease adapter ClpS [Leptospirales bacterium]|nr:ATP-dependent Clp protease adapter ClpS [Leptospirales bacterium]
MSSPTRRQQEEGALLAEERVRPRRPSRYLVIMLNDDYTPMEFVVWVLQRVYHKAMEEATRLMLEVHTQGKSIVGAYTHDVARSKIHQTHELAKKHQHPLTCVLEKEDGDE